MADREFFNTKDEFIDELVYKTTRRFPSLYPNGKQDLLQGANILDRLAMESTIYGDFNLQSAQRCLITSQDSELIISRGEHPNLDRDEYLALILYDRSVNGANGQQAEALHKSICNHRDSLYINQGEEYSKLLIQKAGLLKDENMPYGVRISVLPGITQVFASDILNYQGHYLTFDQALNNGLPTRTATLKGGKRRFITPTLGDNGLRVLVRQSLKDNLNLNASESALNSKKGTTTFIKKRYNLLF